jgi:hypothetical protein
MKKVHLAFAVFLALSHASARAEEVVPVEVLKLRWIDQASPVAEAQAAIEQGDCALLGVYGYTLVVPGVGEARRQELEKECGVRPIDGTGDVWVNKEHGRLIQKATEYVRIYNQYVSRHVPTE